MEGVGILVTHQLQCFSQKFPDKPAQMGLQIFMASLGAPFTARHKAAQPSLVSLLPPAFANATRKSQTRRRKLVFMVN